MPKMSFHFNEEMHNKKHFKDMIVKALIANYNKLPDGPAETAEDAESLKFVIPFDSEEGCNDFYKKYVDDFFWNFDVKSPRDPGAHYQLDGVEPLQAVSQGRLF